MCIGCSTKFSLIDEISIDSLGIFDLTFYDLSVQNEYINVEIPLKPKFKNSSIKSSSNPDENIVIIGAGASGNNS